VVAFKDVRCETVVPPHGISLTEAAGFASELPDLVAHLGFSQSWQAALALSLAMLPPNECTLISPFFIFYRVAGELAPRGTTTNPLGQDVKRLAIVHVALEELLFARLGPGSHPHPSLRGVFGIDCLEVLELEVAAIDVAESLPILDALVNRKRAENAT
jgi:hypothetical protein